MIKHIWLDFSDTIAAIDRNKHNALKIAEYAKIKNVPVTDALITEYNVEFERLGRSNSNVFVTKLGQSSNFWPDLINKHLEIYSLMKPNIPEVIHALTERIPVSVFSNIDTREVMQNLGIGTSELKYVLSSADLKYPKPHIEGYKKVIDLSELPAHEILYIGDDEIKDILPAKSVGLLTGYMWGESRLADYSFKDFNDVHNLVKTQVKS